jgi:hypothetical protein
MSGARPLPAARSGGSPPDPRRDGAGGRGGSAFGRGMDGDDGYAHRGIIDKAIHCGACGDTIRDGAYPPMWSLCSACQTKKRRKKNA